MVRNNVCLFVLLIIWVCGSTTLISNTYGSNAEENLTMVYENGLLSVDAFNIESEQIFEAFGEKCNINIIAHGDVFPEQKVSIHFKNQPLKEAVKRLVKACYLRNYLMDFQKSASGEMQLVKIDLFMGGGGKRVITRAGPASLQKPKTKSTQKGKKAAGQQDKERSELMRRRSFTRGTDFRWDGSAPIAFPQHTGEIDYDKSRFQWEDEAKNFTSKTMDIVPPAVRDVVAEMIVKTSDEVAQEQGAETVTAEITSEALRRIGKNYQLPPDVMQNLPQDMNDLEKSRIPLDPSNLKDEYQQ